jgi:Protein of unknown function (DUF1194).
MRIGPTLRRALCGLALSLPLTAAPAVRACDIALVLAVDVSGSVDAYEYQLQVQGIANALRDEDVRAALLHGQVALAVVQWSGAMEQSVSIPFTRLTEPAEVAQLAARIGTLARAHSGGNTAVGEAIALAVEQFRDVRDCAHWVIDVSGDGDENEGFTVATERREAYARGISINGLAIEAAGTGQPITNFYRRHVVTPGGFVITAHQHSDFARAMREKLLRELIPPMALAPTPDPGRAAVQLAALAGFLHLQTR